MFLQPKCGANQNWSYREGLLTSRQSGLRNLTSSLCHIIIFLGLTQVNPEFCLGYAAVGLDCWEYPRNDHSFCP